MRSAAGAAGSAAASIHAKTTRRGPFEIQLRIM